MAKLIIFHILCLTILISLVASQEGEKKDQPKKTFDKPWKNQKPKYKLGGQAKKADDHDIWQEKEDKVNAAIREEAEKVEAVKKERADKYLALNEEAKRKAQEARDKTKLKIEVEEDLMIHLDGGVFKMGVNDPTSETGEWPVRKQAVKPFKIDRHPVTNGDFAIFKRAKPKYETDAERRGHSYVFFRDMGKGAERLKNFTLKAEPWFMPVKGATWKKPGGPRTNISLMIDHPVIHVSYHDAQAFCSWADKRLPTEMEWEYAARGGLDGKRYPWGDRFERNRANFWQGLFPSENKMGDGYASVSPVNAYTPQNKYGLYDVVGNVWEWTSSEFTMPKRIKKGPRNITDEFRVAPLKDRNYTAKGGSFVDSKDGVINLEARCAARKPIHNEFTSNNIGFRCVKSEVMQDPVKTKKQKEEAARKKAELERQEAEKPKAQRVPRKHFLNETWEYKVKKVLEEVIAGDRDSADSVLEGLKRKKKKDEL